MGGGVSIEHTNTYIMEVPGEKSEKEMFTDWNHYKCIENPPLHSGSSINYK